MTTAPPLLAPADGLPRLLLGKVMHHRLHPVVNRFVYPVFYVLLPMQQLARAENASFAVNRRRSFGLSLDFRDYGLRDGSDPLDWVRQQLHLAGLDDLAGRGEFWLQTFPRMWGYVFNPVSFWFCHDASRQLVAVLAEVSNTFGERCSYLLHHPDLRPIASGEVFTAEKVFHVSPFFSVEGQYRFTFSIPPHAVPETGFPGHVAIDYSDSQGKALLTALWGQPRPWTVRNLRQALWRFPLLTLGVMARIHWQALRLWWKKVPFFRYPGLPEPPLR